MKKESLKEKTYEELRKIASKKKIEGRSKMNKEELVKAILKKSKKKIIKPKNGGGSLISRTLVHENENENENENLEPVKFKNYSQLPTELRQHISNFLPIQNFSKLKKINKSLYKRNRNETIIFETIRNINDYNRIMDILNLYNRKVNIHELIIYNNFTSYINDKLYLLYNKCNIRIIRWIVEIPNISLILPRSLKELYLENYNSPISALNLPQDLEILNMGTKFKLDFFCSHNSLVKLRRLMIVGDNPHIDLIRTRFRGRFSVNTLIPNINFYQEPEPEQNEY